MKGKRVGEIVALCKDCIHSCKQLKPAVIIRCPMYEWKGAQLSLFDLPRKRGSKG